MDLPTAGAAPLLEMRGIIKRFPGVLALDAVDLTLRRGEVHALMGENGAGKSTLVKVLTGVYPRDGGEIVFGDQPLSVRSPGEAQSRGISTIYQEVNLIPDLSVAENIFLGRAPRLLGGARRQTCRQGTGGGSGDPRHRPRASCVGPLNWRAIHERARTLLQTFSLDLDVRLPLGSYPVAIQQMVSIARAVDISSQLIIMDEPTSSLDQQEVERLFGVIRRLRADGVSVLFITHFLDQAYEISDRFTVLRNGRVVGTFEAASLPKLELVGHMLGRDPSTLADISHQPLLTQEADQAEVVLQARGLGRRGALAPTDAMVRHGEVLGLAGLLGSGRTELARLLFGVDRADSGSVWVGRRRLAPGSPRAAIREGLGLCPEDRKTDGLVPDLSVRENIALVIQSHLPPLGRLPRRRQVELAERFIRLLGIVTTGPEQPVRDLSGGNQQKVILARWLAAAPRVLILDEPTRGIDVGGKAEIERLVESLAADGLAVVFISSELEEVVRRSDRVLVLRDRAVVAELTGAAVDEGTIMRTIAAGASERGPA